MAKGGKRPGAGRKVANHTLEAAEGRKLVVAIISKNLAPMLEAMVEKAIKGDVQAFRELMDRGWGRPAQPHVGADGTGPIQVTITNYGGPTTS